MLVGHDLAGFTGAGGHLEAPHVIAEISPPHEAGLGERAEVAEHRGRIAAATAEALDDLGMGQRTCGLAQRREHGDARRRGSKAPLPQLVAQLVVRRAPGGASSHDLPAKRDYPAPIRLNSCRTFAVLERDDDLDEAKGEAKDSHPACGPTEHAPLRVESDPIAIERAVRLFKALGDEARLRTLQMLVGREACVSELATASAEQISTVSHRLRLLRAEGLVQRRRAGRHIYYSLADQHVVELIANALAHASEH